MSASCSGENRDCELIEGEMFYVETVWTLSRPPPSSAARPLTTPRQDAAPDEAEIALAVSDEGGHDLQATQNKPVGNV